MADQQTTASYGKPLAIFVATLIFAQVVIAVGLYAFPNFKLPSATGLIIAMVAAMAAGGVFGKSLGRLMTAGEKLKFAVLATVVGLGLQLAIIAGFLMYFGVPVTASNMVLAVTGESLVSDQDMAMIGIVLAGAAVISLIVCFFFVGMGAKQEVKRAEKLAEKATSGR
ncbi:MAG: ABZJ_00895 family protein [Paracoccaceae bacterium]